MANDGSLKYKETISKKRNLVTKLKDAIVEKRFVKSCFYFLIRFFLPKQAAFKTTFVCEYFFGRKDVNYTRKCIRDINQREKKERIRVVFICWMAEMWSSLRTVYEALEKNPRFEVFILAQPHTTDIKYMKGKNPAYIYLKSQYGCEKVINAYEKESWFDLRSCAPDYVFYSYPYEGYYYTDYMSAEVRKYSKICLIQYGYNFETDATFCASHNFAFLKNVAIHFVADDTIKATLAKVLQNKKYRYPKIVNLGYPRFDLLMTSNEEKSDSCILWTPRWTSPDRKLNKQSHFLSFYENILDYAEKNPEIKIIIRPHPLMFGNFLQKGVMTISEIDSFKHRCNNLSNVELDETPDYIPSIKKASIILSDFTALLAEYFIMEKPIIYCDGNRGFSKEALIMDSSLYHENTWSSIEKRLNLLITGKDEMKEKRQEALKNFLPNGKGQSANNIMTFLENDYLENE